MSRFMLDTDLCVRVLRDRPSHIRLRFNEEVDGLAISTITLHELLYGAARSAQSERSRQEVTDLAARLHVLDFDEQAAAHAGDIRADLAGRGCQIGPFDLLIAGHARSRGLVVVTGNLREFSRVDGLRAEDWLNGTE